LLENWRWTWGCNLVCIPTAVGN